MTYRVGEFVPSDRAEMGGSMLPLELFLSCWNPKDVGVSIQLITNLHLAINFQFKKIVFIIIIIINPLTAMGRWGTTDDFATSFLHFSLFSTALWDLLNSKPVDSHMLSSHPFLCLPCLLPPFTVPCKMVLAKRET